ncbi:MAG: lysylphosphatidylglycerol synthase domain-containing protein [Gammaproteobacteria bacterium]|nr:lysylphosphatidylglycerol synthase domain-containing protein [Gammaproteobacteria bacterium]
MGPPRDTECETLNKWLSLAARVALTVIVTWFILDRVGLTVAELREWQDVVARPRLLPLVGATLLLLAAYALSGLIWGGVVNGLGGPRLSAGDAVSIFMIANMGRYVPGKVWSIAGMAALGKGKGVPVAVSATSAVIMQGTGLVAAGAIGLGAFVGGPVPLPRWGLVGAGVAAGLLLLVLAVPSLFHWAVALWFRIVRTAAPANLTAALVLRWLLQVAVAWVAMGASFWILAASLDMELSPVHAGSAFAAAYVAGYLMLFAPAGVGVREGFLVAILAPALGSGPATVLAIAARLWMTAAEVIPAAMLWGLHQRSLPEPEPKRG